MNEPPQRSPLRSGWVAIRPGEDKWLGGPFTTIPVSMKPAEGESHRGVGSVNSQEARDFASKLTGKEIETLEDALTDERRAREESALRALREALTAKLVAA